MPRRARELPVQRRVPLELHAGHPGGAAAVPGRLLAGTWPSALGCQRGDLPLAGNFAPLKKTPVLPLCASPSSIHLHGVHKCHGPADCPHHLWISGGSAQVDSHMSNRLSVDVYMHDRLSTHNITSSNTDIWKCALAQSGLLKKRCVCPDGRCEDSRAAQRRQQTGWPTWWSRRRSWH